MKRTILSLLCVAPLCVTQVTANDVDVVITATVSSVAPGFNDPTLATLQVGDRVEMHVAIETPGISQPMTSVSYNVDHNHCYVSTPRGVISQATSGWLWMSYEAPDDPLRMEQITSNVDFASPTGEIQAEVAVLSFGGGLFSSWQGGIDFSGLSTAARSMTLSEPATAGSVAALLDSIVFASPPDAGWAGSLFCIPAHANSSGRSTRLTGTWLNGVGISGGMSDLHLECTNGVPNKFGYFLVGTTASNPGILVGNGRLCIASGQFWRYNVGGTNSNSFGVFDTGGVLVNSVGTSSVGSVGMETGFDVPEALAGPSSPVITAGSTWHFQVWHQDTHAGARTSNFSNGLSVTF